MVSNWLSRLIGDSTPRLSEASDGKSSRCGAAVLPPHGEHRLAAGSRDGRNHDAHRTGPFKKDNRYHIREYVAPPTEKKLPSINPGSAEQHGSGKLLCPNRL